MAEVFGNHNEYINGIDVKGDKIPDGFNENQIKNKAKQYIENRIQSGISKENLDQLLKEIKQLLERQDIERLDLMKELRQKEIGESRENIGKEALIQEAKTMIYEKLGINENQSKNSKIENFLKGIVDELVIGNYELAIEIYNTNGAVIIDSLKQLATWEGLKKMAESLGETIWNLFDGNAYEKGKSVAQLGLIGTGVGLGVTIGKKGLKLGMKELAKLRSHKENIIASSEVKGVVKETSKKVDEIVPKKQLDFNKMLVEDIAKLGDKERLEAGSFYLKGKKFTPEQQKAILEAHNIGLPNKDGKFDIGDLRKKYIMLEKAGFNDNEIRALMEKGVCGKDKLPSLNSLYSHPKYSFLEKYKEILGENLNINDIVGEGTQAIILRHPTNEKLVIKIAKPGEVDDIMKEFHNHQLFHEKVKELKRQGLIDDKIKIPYVIGGEKSGYFFMEKVDGQSLYSKTLIDRFSHKLSPEEIEQIGKLDDKQVREFLKKNFKETDSYLDQIIEDYSVDKLSELLGNTYKIRRETGKTGGTPLDNAIKTLGKNGIAHNDLHPGNIMIDRNGNIYMIDFGRIKEFNK
nr:phosphotransferase [Candidatus Gracilibacteria bacterium]